MRRQVKYAVANNLEIAIKGGGHSCSAASSSEDLVIDLSKYMNTASVDPEKRLLTVGGGKPSFMQGGRSARWPL